MMDETPLSRTFSSLSEYQQALDQVIEQARHTLYLFDYDLHEGGWNGPQRYEVLKRFVLGSPHNRLHIALHSTDYVRRNCPRLLNFQRQYTYAVLIHETNPEARSINDPMLVADGRHYVHRFHYEQARGELVLHDPEQTLRLAQRFDEIWHASSVAVTATTLGL
jgi:hypothetical protein